MHGSRSIDDLAQLALLDAMIFFVIVLAICGSLVTVVDLREPSDDAAVWSDQIDASEFLSSYLQTSVGCSVEVPSYPALEMNGRESMADVLMVVCSLLIDGVDLECLEPLPSILLGHLVSACPIHLEPHLVALRQSGDDSYEILTLEECARSDSETMSSSQRMVDGDGHPFLVVLLLDPALGLHGLGV